MVTFALASIQKAGLGRSDGFRDEKEVGTVGERLQPLRLTSVVAGVDPTPDVLNCLLVHYHQLPGVHRSTSWDNQESEEILTWEGKGRGPNGRSFVAQFQPGSDR